MKIKTTTTSRQPAGHRRSIKSTMVAPSETASDPFAWLDALSDDEVADIIGPSWTKLTGRCIEDLEIVWTMGEGTKP